MQRADQYSHAPKMRWDARQVSMHSHVNEGKRLASESVSLDLVENCVPSLKVTTSYGAFRLCQSVMIKHYMAIPFR